MILLIVSDFRDGGSYWFYWPLLGWGIFIVSHAIKLFGLGRFLGSDWEKKKIQEEMDKLDNE